MIDFHNLPGEAAGTLVAINVRRDPSGELSWDLDVAYQFIPAPDTNSALEHALPGTSKLVEEGLTRARKVTVNDSTEREDIRMTVTSIDTGEEVVCGDVAEIRNVVLRVKNDVSITTVRYRVCGGPDQYSPALRYLDARVMTKAEAVQVSLPFPSPTTQAPIFPGVNVGDLVSGVDFSGVITCGIVLDVRGETVDVSEMSGMVVRLSRDGMSPPVPVSAPGYDNPGLWAGALQEKASGTGIRPTWSDVIQVVGMSYMADRDGSRSESGEFILDSTIMDALLEKGEVAN